MRALVGLIAVAASFVVMLPAAQARDGNAVIGRAIFVRDNCASCHGGRAGGGFGPNIRDNRPNDNTIERVLLRGTRTGMPSYRGLLSRRDIQNLIAYIRSLRDNDEPVSTHWWEFIPDRPSRCC